MNYFDLQEVETENRQDLISYVIQSITSQEMLIATCMNPKFGGALEHIFRPAGGLGGDHLWAIEHLPGKGGLGQFRLYRGDDIDGTEENSVYDADEVIEALIKAFDDHKIHFPDHQATVDEILKLIPQYRENLRT